MIIEDLFKNMSPEEIELGSWLSASLEDYSTCTEFREAARNWFKYIEERGTMALNYKPKPYRDMLVKRELG